MDNEARVRAAVAGDVEAMTALLDECAPEVERSLEIAPRWRSVLEVADIMQVTYLEAFLRISRYDPGRSEPFRAWLQRIAENNLRDAIRGLQAQKRPQPTQRVAMPVGHDSGAELLEVLGVTTTTPSRVVSKEERNQKLHAVLDSMPEDYAKVVRMYDLECLPIEEVAARMKRSTGAVHMLRARAHERLRPLLGTESVWFGTST